MPSIESLYLQNEKAVDKCTVNSHETTRTTSFEDIGRDILEGKVKELDKNMESIKEAVEIDELQGPDTLVVIKIEEKSDREGQDEDIPSSEKWDGEAEKVHSVKNAKEGKTQSVNPAPEKLKDEDEKNGENVSKTVREKWNNIWAKFCPDFNQEKNRLLKANLSAILTKSVTKSDDLLLKRLEGMSIGGDKNGLTSKGPGQTTYQNAEMSPQCSPAYIHSPGQLTSMSSPPHESSILQTFAMLQTDLKSSTGAGDLYQWHNSNSYYPVSPPNSSYQSDHSISDAEYNMNHVSPQSPDDGPQDIPTVMATAMHSIVPGEYQPTVNNQHLVDTWTSQSSMASSQGIDPHGRTDYDVQNWPDSPYGNPPSVSSISDIDSEVFGSPSPCNIAMSPASASGGSAVQSPAPTPPISTQWHPPQTTTTFPSDRYMTITSSTNINFGVVQVQRISSSSCSSPPQLFREASPSEHIKSLENYLKTPDMETQPQPLPLPLPPINSIFSPSLPHPYKAPSIMRPMTNIASPYSRPQNPISPKSYTQMVSPSSSASSQPNEPITLSTATQYIAPIEQMTRQTHCPPAYKSVYQQNALSLSAEDLQQRDCSDPYEGENLLQKLIVNQTSDQAMAIIERMVQLRVSLDATNDLGQSPLLLAVINDMPRVVGCLMHYNADVLNGDKKGTYPIHYAASHGFTDVISAICESHQSVDLDRLDFNGKTPLMCAVETHQTTQTVYQNGREVERFVNNFVTTQKLIDSGAQPTKRDARSGKTALHYAIGDFKLDMIRIILEGDETVKVARVPMSDGNTPLHLAVALKCEQSVKCEIIRYLIHKGADISATNVERVKPLDLVTDGHKEVKECLEQYSKSKRR